MKALLFAARERQLAAIGKADLNSGWSWSPWEFSLSEHQGTVELVCKNGHKVLLSAARIQAGRHLWCAKCGADLRAEDGQQPVNADDPRRAPETPAPPALRTVSDRGRSR